MIPNGLISGRNRGVAYDVPNSGAFAAEQSDYLSKTLTTGATITISVLLKRSNLGAVMGIVEGALQFNANDTITAFGLTTTAVFRDVANFYHICVSNNGLEVNGVYLGAVTTSALTNPDIGRTGTSYFSGYISEIHLVESLKDSADFAKTDPITGQWVAKAYAGTYGTNGFYLNFQNGASLGEDSSGNGNDFTNSGVTQSTDTPTDNHCICNVDTHEYVNSDSEEEHIETK